ncbi:histidine ammonia-lyase [Rhizobium leguminosarum]|uniref:HAL/PAL/TAL family ammonia-lyase n=1 Tax=Rhizobium leguminosarum TaxID=384 RepID=UPI001C90E65E|nr:histidine ammonia-lyase [Rhizobium leguminosarum]MBY2991152.1 histidine ammonia-lyase [Rhizobium leguminosarum]MBY3057331.1 histidine ammonia-lyase [Rhizobium leguminosarum]
MTPLLLTGSGIVIADIVAIARRNVVVEQGADVAPRLARARHILETAAASGQQIYGMNTGLGANLGTEVTADFEAFQLQLVRGRAMGVGPALPRDVTRAVMAARLAMLAVGGSGISPPVFEALLALLNAGVHPLIPSIGSIGAGDLVLLSSIARCLIGEGEAEYAGAIHPAHEALRLAGLTPVTLRPKDGISLLNASAVSVGQGALALHDARQLLGRQRQAAALSFEGLGGNPLILSPAIQKARPSIGQAEEAARLLEALTGSTLFKTKAAIQDPLSLRCVAPIHGVLAEALRRAEQTIEIELNAAADNPLVIPDEERVLSTGNFHTPSLSLAFETLGLAIAQVASASAARFVQLTGSGRNGLPRYLSPVGGASAGFVPMQKVVAALTAAIRHKANPVMLDFLAVSEGVEDHATQSSLVVQKLAEMLELWRQVIACEMLAAAQAVDQRPQHHCGQGTRETFDLVRQIAPAMVDDRPLGEDASALASYLRRDE